MSSVQEVRSVYSPNVAFVDNDSNGGTDIELVAAVTGYRIVVDTLVVSVSATTTGFFLESGASTVIFPTCCFAANSTTQIDDPFVRTTSGAALTFSATITGNISVFVRYHLES